MAGIDIPWLEPTLDGLLDRHRSDRLPHALLISGQAGIGKLTLSEVFANQLLCRNGSHCGDCKDCHLLSAGSHPDLRVVSPEEDSKQIKIEQVRSLIDWVNQTAQIAKFKVAILNPAHAMNRNSANALLKVMEEPPPNTYLILVSAEPARLLATVRSRAQSIAVATPPLNVATKWLVDQGRQQADAELLLRLSDGAPVAASEEFDDGFLADRKAISLAWTKLVGGNADVVNTVASLGKMDAEQVVLIGLSLFQDVARQHHDLPLVNSDLVEQIRAMALQVDSKQALNAVNRLERDLMQLKGSQNPNKTLLLEHLMLDCQQMETVSFSL